MSADSSPPPPDFEPDLSPDASALQPPGSMAEPGERRRRSRRGGGEPAGTNNDQIAALSSLLANLVEKRGGGTNAPKEIFRFRDRGAEAAAPKTSPGDAEGASESALGGSARGLSLPASVSGNAPAPVEAPRVERSRTPLIEKGQTVWLAPQEEVSRRWPGIWYWALTVLLGVACFFAGRKTISPAASSTRGPSVADQPAAAWSPKDVSQLDRSLEADQAGDLDKANQIAAGLMTQAGPLPGLEVYLRLIEARRQSVPNAQAALMRMFPPGLEGARLASVANGLAFVYARRRDFASASTFLKQVVGAEPFTAENFRRLGESQRREGNLQEAITAFRQALDRYPVGAVEFADVREYARYKIRLTEIEGGFPQDVRGEPDEREATADSAGYWFLTEAAAALQRADQEGAAGALEKAKAALPGPLFTQLLGDYFFRASASRPRLASFFPSDQDKPQNKLKERLVYFIDP